MDNKFWRYYRVLQKHSALKLSVKAKKFRRFQKSSFLRGGQKLSVFFLQTLISKTFGVFRRKVKNDKLKFKYFG